MWTPRRRTAWVTNAPSCWHVDASETNSVYLLIDIDNTVLTNDVVIKLSIYDHTNATLHVDLLDSNAVVIAANIVGNISPGNDAAATVLFDVPVLTHTNTTTISLRRDSGEVTVYDTLVYIDQDGDGLDADQEAQLGTSDYNTDSDGDGISDYDEVFIYGTDPTLADTDGDGLSDSFELSFQPSSLNPLSSDTDGDGLSDGAEVNTYGTNPNNPDSDGDGMADGWEVAHGFNPMSGGVVAGYWGLDEADGTVASDTSGNGNDGTISGASHVAGIFGNGLQFDGSDDAVTVTNSPDYKCAALTVSCFSRFDALFGNAVSGGAEDGRMVLVAQANAGGGYGYALYKTVRNSLVFEIANSAATNAVLAESSDALVSTGAWYSVIGTYDGTNACLYIDGELAASAAYSLALEYDAASGLELGNSPSGMDSSYFDGALDSVRVLAGAMTAEEIAEPYADLDGDAMSNVEEAQYGTNPYSQNSDGDGLGDAAEINTYGTDPLDSDTDNDGMPDGWEVANGLDPLDAADAAGDPDNDGLANLQEYQHGTDPNNPDTDRDGTPDGWEVVNGLNPLSASDASHDTDGDGLNNLGEYLAGTAVGDADSDDDGMYDGEEVHTFYTDPLVANLPLVSTWIQVSSLAGDQFTASFGDWVVESGTVYAADRGGYVEYGMSVPANGYYALQLIVAEHNSLLATPGKFDVSVSVDGHLTGRRVISIAGATGTGLFATPWLTTGEHTVRIQWNDFTERSVLEIVSLSLMDLGGEDADDNGRPDWMDNRLENTSGVLPQEVSSIVSPICLEGYSLYPEMLGIHVSYIPEGQTSQLVNTSHAVDIGWFADILLSPTNETTITVTDQGGLFTATNSVSWIPVNLTEGLYTNPLVREGTAMLLTSYPTNATDGTVTIEVLDGEGVLTNVVTDIDNPAEYWFMTNGDYTVSGSFSNAVLQTNATMLVRVRGGGFAADPACTVGAAARTWDCPALPSEATIEKDQCVTFTTNALPGGGMSFNLKTSESGSNYIVARLGQGGPILDSAEVTGLESALLGRWTLNGYTLLESGTEMYSLRLNLGPDVPSGITVCLTLVSGGVTFDDGTRTRWINASDFNAMGEYTYNIIKGPYNTVCHGVRIYSNGVLIMQF